LLATSLTDPQLAFSLDRSRMKIEHGFRDWKTHLRLKNTLTSTHFPSSTCCVIVVIVLG